MVRLHRSIQSIQPLKIHYLNYKKVDGGNLGSDTNKDVGIVMNYYDGSAKKSSDLLG